MEVSSFQDSPSSSSLGTPPLRRCLWSRVIYSSTKTSHNRQINTQMPFQHLLWEKEVLTWGQDVGGKMFPSNSIGWQALGLHPAWPEVLCAPKLVSAFDSVSVFISQFSFVWIHCSLIKRTPREHAQGQGDSKSFECLYIWVWARFAFPP